MNASKSRRAIIADYEKYDRRLTVMNFDKDGNRTMTYQSYGFHAALALAVRLMNRGSFPKVYVDLMEHHYYARNVREIPESYLFNDGLENGVII